MTITDQVLTAAAAKGWPEIPACGATGFCWLSAGEVRWRAQVHGVSPSVLRQWLAALEAWEREERTG